MQRKFARPLSFEPLEARRAMAVILGETYNPPNPGEEVGFVAPEVPGLSPISLPAGIVPDGTT